MLTMKADNDDGMYYVEPEYVYTYSELIFLHMLTMNEDCDDGICYVEPEYVCMHSELLVFHAVGYLDDDM
jgi:hypothetical protein